MYSALATGSNGISADETNGIAISRNLTALRCTMYAAGGFTQILDIETIPVAIDVDALTHEDIFNLLTNNGAWQGIYRGSDGKLYINFTYGRGGALNLGGKATTYGDGELHVYNFFDKEIVTIDTDGILVNNYMLGISEDEKPQSYTCLTNGVFNDGLFVSKNKDGSGKAAVISPTKIIVKNNTDKADTFLSLKGGTQLTENSISVKPDGWTVNLFYAGLNTDSNNSDVYATADVVSITSHVRTTVYGDFNVTGTKNRIIDTENYDTRKQYCYETATPYFGDIGTAQTDETGKCYIDIDDIFAETVNTGVEYQVFLQKEGQGDIWVEEKTDSYFAVKGTENLKFSWEIKAIQKDYEFERLEKFDNSEKEEVIDYEKEYMEEINDLIKEQEEMLNETVE